jgi:two-component system, NtrC family, sensor kinase
VKIIIFVFLVFSNYSFTQNTSENKIIAIPKEGLLLSENWKWHDGDNLEFSRSDFDDSTWKNIDPSKTIPQLQQLNKINIFWLRLKFNVESAQPVAISIRQSGASEIYLNENLIMSYGQIKDKSKPTIAFDPQNETTIITLNKGPNVLAVRYSFQKDLKYNSVYNISFPLFLAIIKNQIFPPTIDVHIWNGFNIGVPFILFIVHFIFFVFYPKNKTNLWYSLSSFFGFLSALVLLKLQISNSVGSKNILTNYAAILGFLQNSLLYYTIYLFLNQKNTWLIIVFIFGSILGIFLNYFNYFQSSITFNYLLTLFYVISVVYMGNQAWKNGEKGGIYLIISMVGYIIFWSLFVISFTYNWGSLSNDILFHISGLIVPIIISVLLALDFRNTNNLLVENLKKINILSSEKQQILSDQNEILEKQVIIRTAELKKSQQQLIQKEKLASLGELTAGIAHEIQNPLNFVNNFSEVSTELVDELKEELDKGSIEEAKGISDDLKQNLLKISQHGKRAENIVKGMLQHSRTNTGHKETTDINSLCNEYVDLAYHGFQTIDKTFKVIIETNFDQNIPKLEIVPQDIGRVILNLINNAFYAVNERSKDIERVGFSSGAGGKSGQGQESNYVPTVSITTQLTPNSQLQISIKDNGSGIPEHIKGKIFQPFFTTKPTGQGTGLGLSLAYDIVKAHGGELTLESNDGGTEFSIKIPVK